MFEVKERWLILNISSKLMNLDYSLDNKDYNFIIGIELSCFTIGKNLFFFISSDLHLLSTRHMWLFHEFHTLLAQLIRWSCVTVTCHIFFTFIFKFYGYHYSLWINLAVISLHSILDECMFVCKSYSHYINSSVIISFFSLY